MVGGNMRSHAGVAMESQQRTISLKLDLSVREILRAMGNAPNQPVRQEVLSLVSTLLSEATRHLDVRGTYVVHKVKQARPDLLELENCPPFRGPAASRLGITGRVAVFVVTVGDALDQMAERLTREGKPAEGFILHAIGSVAADAACESLVEHLWENETREREALTAPFCPGYCGLPIQEQKTLFSILDTSAIAVSLLPSMMMNPVKSVSGLVGIGPADRIEALGVPCEHCPDDNCMMRRGLA